MEALSSLLPPLVGSSPLRLPIRSQQERHERHGRSEQSPSPSSSSSRSSSMCCCHCGRRRVLQALAASLPVAPAATGIPSLPDKSILDVAPFQRQGWYDELFALQMDQGMKAYEAQMAGYKNQLFSRVDGMTHDVLEIGIGTGPNIKYYASKPQISLTGVDPNPSMEKYAHAAACSAGLPDSQFKFVQGVGESLPVGTSSFDAVICTLVLCSVLDVDATLKEVKRVLRPGGSFFFIEHIAAPVGSTLRIWQEFFDPVQQFVADGCHLTRDTLNNIEGAGFASVSAKRIDVSNLSLLSPHIVGIAQV